MKRIIFAHPFLFALFPIISMTAANITEVEPDVLYRPAMMALAGAAILLLLFSLLLRRIDKGALLATVWLLLFFSYGHLYNSLVGSGLLGAAGQARYFLAAWILLGLAGSIAVMKTKRDLSKATQFLNFMAIVMLIMPLLTIFNYERSRQETLSIRSDQAQEKAVAKPVPPVRLASGKKSAIEQPDIYYLVFDRYSSAPRLKDVLDFDNSAFTDYLKDRGFFVAEESRANYAVTYLSLSSSLNLDYHESARDQKDVEPIIQDYKVWRFLKERGYKFVHYGSAWPPTNSNQFADQSVNYYELDFDSFSRLLLNTTMAGPVLDRFYPQEEDNRNRMLSQLQALAKAPRMKGPKFVFAHILMPHTPYLFDAQGRPLSAEEQAEAVEEDLYRDYILFANGKIRSLLDTLLVDSERPPIVVIQADEGFRYNAESNKERYAKPGYMELHYGVLNAYYLPGVEATDYVYDDITPVNSFRAVFNAYFDTDFEMLEDENFMLLRKSGKASGFKRITDQLN